MILLWSANPFLWLSWLWLLMNHSRGAFVMSSLGFLFASIAILLQLAPEFGSGYYLWLVSFVAAMIAGVANYRCKRPALAVTYLKKRLLQFAGMGVLISAIGFYVLIGDVFLTQDTFRIYVLLITGIAGSLVWAIAWSTVTIAPLVTKSRPEILETNASTQPSE